MKVKTSEAVGMVLDWAAAKAAGLEHAKSIVRKKPIKTPFHYAEFEPSTCAAQGAPLLEEFSISTECLDAHDPERRRWVARSVAGHVQQGPTLLIAGMRCLAAQHFGDEIDVQEFLGIQAS